MNLQECTRYQECLWLFCNENEFKLNKKKQSKIRISFMFQEIKQKKRMPILLFTALTFLKLNENIS